jgi:hypothetical protein
MPCGWLPPRRTWVSCRLHLRGTDQPAGSGRRAPSKSHQLMLGRYGASGPVPRVAGLLTSRSSRPRRSIAGRLLPSRDRHRRTIANRRRLERIIAQMEQTSTATGDLLLTDRLAGAPPGEQVVTSGNGGQTVTEKCGTSGRRVRGAQNEGSRPRGRELAVAGIPSRRRGAVGCGTAMVRTWQWRTRLFNGRRST